MDNTLNEIKQQWQLLQDKLESQSIVNDKLIRRIINSNAAFLYAVWPLNAIILLDIVGAILACVTVAISSPTFAFICTLLLFPLKSPLIISNLSFLASSTFGNIICIPLLRLLYVYIGFIP